MEIFLEKVNKYIENNFKENWQQMRVFEKSNTLDFYSLISLASFPIALVSIRET